MGDVGQDCRLGDQETSSVPKVTLILATFNDAPSLARAIESILAQTITAWRLLIVNDGSNDNTVEVLEEYRADPRITILTNSKNRGLATSLNTALEHCSTEFIARVDADDIQLSHRLDYQLTVLRHHPEVDLLGSNIRQVFSDGRRVVGPFTNRSNEEVIEHLANSNVICHPTVMFRKSFFEKAGHYDPRMRRSQDWELWLRGVKAGCKFLTTDEMVTDYWTNDYRRSSKVVFQYVKARLIIFTRYQSTKNLPKLIRDIAFVVLKALK